MRFKFIVLISLVLVTLALARQRKGDTTQETSNREGKLFSLFTIVNFKNEPCTSTDSLSSGSTNYRNGTCYTSSECSSKGGSSKGGCAAGFGVCCVFTLKDTSSLTVNQNDTYIQNPNFPSTYGETNTLSYTINKCSNDICWLRLDFETFNTVAPTDTAETAGYACNDMMTVTTSSGQNVPVLCGDLTGQHIYVDIGAGNSDTATLALAFNGANTNRKWDIKIAQIPCGARYAPPGSCLQWQTGLTGQITTFNFPDTDGPHLPNQDYSHCIRQAAGYCCVEYSVCGSGFEQYSLSITADPTIANDASLKAAIGSECLTTDGATTVTTGDYITIESSGANCGAASTSRYCGQSLNSQTMVLYDTPICDCTPPFAVGIFTDQNADAAAAVANAINRGVCLNYRQLPCTNSN